MGCMNSNKREGFLSFQNVLSAPLSKNPQEFKGQIDDKNIRKLYEFSDMIYNPKNKNKIEIKVSQIMGNIPSFTESISEIISSLSAKIDKEITCDQILNSTLYEICSMCDKSLPSLMHESMASAKLDTKCVSLNFQKFQDLQIFADFSSYQQNDEHFNLEIVKKDPFQLLYQILDSSYRLLLITYYKNIGIANVKELKEKQMTEIDNLTTVKSLKYTESVFTSIKQTYDDQNNLSIENKVMYAINMVAQFSQIGLSEIDRQFYEQCKLKQSKDQHIFPESYPLDQNGADESFITMFMSSKSSPPFKHIKSIYDNRILLFELDSGHQVILVHLPSGDDVEGRKKQLNEIFAEVKASGKVIIMGDFNEDLVVNSPIQNLLKEKGFQLGEEELIKTVYKERSAMQQQINKMSKKDHTAKDGIFTNQGWIPQRNFSHPLSDHDIVMIDKDI